MIDDTINPDDFDLNLIDADDHQRRRQHECDENCRGCAQCYQRTGDTVCDRVCPHAEPDEDEDDGTCEHGIAADVHCCECGRSGFFPPADCRCVFDFNDGREKDDDDGVEYADPRDERDERRNRD